MDRQILDKIKSIDAINMRVLVYKSNDSSPQKRSLTTRASQEVKLFLLIVETMFGRVDFHL